MTKKFLAAELARILPHVEYVEMPFMEMETERDPYGIKLPSNRRSPVPYRLRC